MEIPVTEIRLSDDRLIFSIGISLLGIGMFILWRPPDLITAPYGGKGLDGFADDNSILCTVLYLPNDIWIYQAAIFVFRVGRLLWNLLDDCFLCKSMSRPFSPSAQVVYVCREPDHWWICAARAWHLNGYRYHTVVTPVELQSGGKLYDHVSMGCWHFVRYCATRITFVNSSPEIIEFNSSYANS